MLSGTNNINSRANRTRDYCVNTALMFKISDVGYVAVAAKEVVHSALFTSSVIIDRS